MSHIHDKIDFTVGVFVVYKDKVLLRLHEKYHLWLSVGGHVDLGEDPTEAAVGEVKEEVGLDVKLWGGNKKFLGNRKVNDYKELIPPVGMNRHRISPTHEHVDFTYFATSTTDKVIPENHDDEWKWLTKDELSSQDILPDIKFYAELALEKLNR